MEPIGRREFLKGSALAASAASGWAGANDRIRLALIGAGGRGGDHMKLASAIEGVEIAAICDPDETRMAKMASALAGRTGGKPALQADLRRVLEDKNIDAVSIATCNHWHALAAIWACQAGKHVYVEKPLSHNFFEGRQVVAAARKYNRIVQGGTQSRSNGYVRKAIQALREGVIGDVYMARVIHYEPRPSIGFKNPEPPPSWLHWDLWLGPAPDQPYHGNLVHYNWHWFWDFGGGELANNGPHMLDLARWGLNKGLPEKVHAIGGRYGYQDQAQTPNTMTLTYAFADGVNIVTEIRGRFTNPEADADTGVIFYGSKGYLAIERDRTHGRSKLFLNGSKTPEPDLGAIEGWDPKENDQAAHYRNFIDAVRANNRGLLRAEVHETHLSTAYPLLGNIAYRLGRGLRFDAKTERFAGDAEADRMLPRRFRAPFTVPEKV